MHFVSSFTAIPIQVLLVEDNLLNLEIEKNLLLSLGLSVETATNGQEALERFLSSKEGTYQCIFMDLQMPILNGIETTKQIRALHRSDANLPIFAITANSYEIDCKQALEAGMQDYFEKPISVEQISFLLNQWALIK